MLFRLAYYSTNLIKKSVDPRRSELRRIVLASGVNNRKQGITGGLMFNRNYFGQVLEGERSAVSKLFCQIAQDPRHRSVTIVEACPVDTRLFQYWSMGLAERTGTAETLNRKFEFDHGFDPTNMNAGIFLRYVFEMVKLEDQLISVSVPT